MAGEKIFIVEDERIVAEDLKRMLERLGYNVIGSAASGDEALKKMATTKPDLVLMDIRIQGALDGIDVAEHVVAEYDVPIIYLTAYADDVTVDRAKGTLPAAYILKPFEEQSLKTTIDLAVYRHNMNQMMKNLGDWHAEILQNLSVAVMAVDPTRHITYMNKLAESLTGQMLDKALGKICDDVFSLKKFEIKESAILDLEGKAMGTALVLKEINS